MNDRAKSTFLVPELNKIYYRMKIPENWVNFNFLLASTHTKVGKMKCDSTLYYAWLIVWYLF